MRTRIIKFIFDETKATQAASYVLSLNGGRMNYMKLIKLLYLSDREAIMKWRNTITTDTYVSMPQGPVTSNIYDKIKLCTDDAGDEWSTYIRNTGNYNVQLVKEPSYNLLSRRELRAMEEVNRKFVSFSEFDMVKYCHDELKEWHDPNGSSIYLAIEDILEATAPETELDDSIVDMLEASESQNNMFMMRNRC